MSATGTRVCNVRNHSADVHGGYYRQRSDAAGSLRHYCRRRKDGTYLHCRTDIQYCQCICLFASLHRFRNRSAHQAVRQDTTTLFFDIDRFSTASLITRLTSDISRIQQVIQVSMRLMLRSPLMLVMAVFFVVRINLELAGVLLAAIPVLGFSVFFILRKGFPFFLKVQQKVDQLNEVVRENLINIRVVKSFVREDFEARKFKDKSESLRDTVIHASNIIVAIFPVMQLVMNLSIIAILWMGGQKVMAGELKVGELISFVNYLAQVLMSLMMLSMIIMTYARASASSKRILEVLDTQPSLTDTPEGMRSTRQIERERFALRRSASVMAEARRMCCGT